MQKRNSEAPNDAQKPQSQPQPAETDTSVRPSLAKRFSMDHSSRKSSTSSRTVPSNTTSPRPTDTTDLSFGSIACVAEQDIDELCPTATPKDAAAGPAVAEPGETSVTHEIRSPESQVAETKGVDPHEAVADEPLVASPDDQPQTAEPHGEEPKPAEQPGGETRHVEPQSSDSRQSEPQGRESQHVEPQSNKLVSAESRRSEVPDVDSQPAAESQHDEPLNTEPLEIKVQAPQDKPSTSPETQHPGALPAIQFAKPIEQGPFAESAQATQEEDPAFVAVQDDAVSPAEAQSQPRSLSPVPAPALTETALRRARLPMEAAPVNLVDNEGAAPADVVAKRVQEAPSLAPTPKAALERAPTAPALATTPKAAPILDRAPTEPALTRTTGGMPTLDTASTASATAERVMSPVSLTTGQPGGPTLRPQPSLSSTASPSLPWSSPPQLPADSTSEAGPSSTSSHSSPVLSSQLAPSPPLDSLPARTDIPSATSLSSLPFNEGETRSSATFLGAIGKRGWDAMRQLRQAPATRKRDQKPDSRRRSFFGPTIHHSRSDLSKRAQSPTTVWLDWLESPVTSPMGSPPLASVSPGSLSSAAASRARRMVHIPPLSLPTSTSMQSLSRHTEASAPTGIFGTPLREAIAACHLGAMPETPLPEAQSSADVPLKERPQLLQRAEARAQYIPRIVTRSIESLEKWGVQEEGLYRISGRSSHSSRLRALWDSPAMDLDMAAIAPADLDVHAVCSVLKMYLRELPDPLLPKDVTQVFDRLCTEAAGGSPLTPDMQRQLAPQLAPLMAQVPICEWYLLRELADHLGRLTEPATVERTKMPLSNLTLVLAPTVQISVVTLMTVVQLRDVLFNDETRPAPDAALAHEVLEGDAYRQSTMARGWRGADTPASASRQIPSVKSVTDPDRPSLMSKPSAGALRNKPSMFSAELNVATPGASDTAHTRALDPVSEPTGKEGCARTPQGAPLGSASATTAPSATETLLTDAKTPLGIYPAEQGTPTPEDKSALDPVLKPALTSAFFHKNSEKCSQAADANPSHKDHQGNSCNMAPKEQGAHAVKEDASGIKDATPSNGSSTTALPIADRFSQPRSSILAGMLRAEAAKHF